MDCSLSKHLRIQDFDTITYFSVQFRKYVDETWFIDMLAFVCAILHINREFAALSRFWPRTPPIFFQGSQA